MPSITPETASQVRRLDGVDGRYHNFDGEGGDTSMNAAFETYDKDVDWSELMKVLPGGLCTTPHWGYCFEGKVTFIYDDREETFKAGEAFYAPSGHRTRTYAGSRCLMFSNVAGAQQVIDEVLGGNEKG